jgi:hypothetical protein
VVEKRHVYIFLTKWVRCLDEQDMLMQMHKQCEFFAHSVQYNPRDDQAFASWGSMLMHLSMVCEQQVLRVNCYRPLRTRREGTSRGCH